VGERRGPIGAATQSDRAASRKAAIPPLQGYCLRWVYQPRALPWAMLLRPVGAYPVSTQKLRSSVRAICHRMAATPRQRSRAATRVFRRRASGSATRIVAKRLRGRKSGRSGLERRRRSGQSTRWSRLERACSSRQASTWRGRARDRWSRFCL